MSGSVWEGLAGFCRAIRRKDRIMVSGTTATYGKDAVADCGALESNMSSAAATAATAATAASAPASEVASSAADEKNRQKRAQMCARAQTTFILDKIEASIRMLGGAGLQDVSRTRIFVPHTTRDWLPIALEHGRRFSDHPPANTLVGAALVGEGDEYQVEIEAEAEL